MNERRRARRRTIPFLRGGVLHVGQRDHIVAIVDLSPEGAFLATRVEIPQGQEVRLTAVLPRSGRQVTLPCEVVWRNDRFDADTGRPAGMAVRFSGKDEPVRQHLESISEEGLFPLPISATRDRFEYRMVEKADIDLNDLNDLGRDGWALTAAITDGAVCRLVFCRRL
jgi:Tfp pilus assembly protein PilZ